MKVVVWLFDRFVPTLLMGSSAALLAVGVLSYAPSAFGQWQTPEPTVGDDPLFETTPAPSPLATGQTEPPLTPGPGTTASPVPIGPTPTPASVPPGNAVVTRVVIASLDIDLPVVAGDLEVRGNEGNYPLCDVAMYMVGFVNPGQPGTTYIYGHAQAGMFAPLLHASKYKDGASMIGALVEVYTNDSMLHLYEITLVKRHATDLSITRVPAGVHQLVLQTSEGWHGHIPKLQVAARPLTVLAASDRDAHPSPHPRVCLPD